MMDRTNRSASTWRTSSYSTGGNQCVEVAVMPDGQVAVRDTRDRESGIQLFSAAAWRTFMVAVRREA
jgi:hypothetical protein